MSHENECRKTQATITLNPKLKLGDLKSSEALGQIRHRPCALGLQMLFGYTLRYSQLKHKKSVAELVVQSRTIYVSGYILQSDPAAASCSYTGIYCIRSCNNFCLIIVVRENDLSGQTYLYKIIYHHSQILANTLNIMGTLRSAECPQNIERITSSKIFSLRVVYSKLLGGKSRIVKLVCEMKKKIGSFT